MLHFNNNIASKYGLIRHRDLSEIPEHQKINFIDRVCQSKSTENIDVKLELYQLTYLSTIAYIQAFPAVTNTHLNKKSKSGLSFIFAGIFLQENHREVTHQSLVELLEKCNISNERQKEKQLSLSSDWLSLSTECEKEFKVDDDFLARCASFFGNKDIKVTWQSSNFEVKKRLDRYIELFNFREEEIMEIRKPAQSK